MSDAHKAASAIMALVDEFPSGPFSLERREIEDRIYLLLCKYSQQVQDDAEDFYDQGYEEGRYSANQELEDEHSEEITNLEERIQELEQELREAQEQSDQSFAAGYEAGSKDEDITVELS